MSIDSLSNISEIAKVVKQLAETITNVVGLIQKNVIAYHEIKDDFLLRRQIERLEKLQRVLSSWRNANRTTLMQIASRAAEIDTGEEYPVNTSMSDERTASSMRSFLEDVIETSALLKEYHADVISIDYRLFELLEQNLEDRKRLLEIISHPDYPDMLSHEKLVQLYNAYASLVEALASLKSILQERVRALKETAPNKKDVSKDDAPE